MANQPRTVLPRLGALLRIGALTLVAGLWRRASVKELNARLAARPLWDQVWITGGVFVALLALALIAAQFGWIGILLFWLAIIIIVN